MRRVIEYAIRVVVIASASALAIALGGVCAGCFADGNCLGGVAAAGGVLFLLQVIAAGSDAG